MKIDSIEQKVIEMLLADQCEAARVLQEQAEQMRLVSREMTGVGFFLEFDVRQELALPKAPNFRLKGVYGRHPDEAGALCFILLVREGRIHSLEGVAFVDRWPTDLSKTVLEFRESEHAIDLQTLRSM